MDEVRRNAEAVPIVNPHARKIRHQAKRQVHRAQRKTHFPEARGNLDRGDFAGGAGGGHARNLPSVKTRSLFPTES